MSNPELVTALDLDQWSESMASKSMLPVLVRRLILATASVTEITMRAREGVLLPGGTGWSAATAMTRTFPAASPPGSWAPEAGTVQGPVRPQGPDR